MLYMALFTAIVWALIFLTELRSLPRVSIAILHLQIGHVGGEAQKNVLLVLLWAPTNVGEKHCQVCPKRLVAS